MDNFYQYHVPKHVCFYAAVNGKKYLYPDTSIDCFSVEVVFISVVKLRLSSCGLCRNIPLECGYGLL